MNNLACVYGDLNQLENAEKLFVRCLELRTAKFGEHHIDTVSTMSNLSGLYVKMGQLDKAQLLGTKAVDISTKLLGMIITHITHLMLLTVVRKFLLGDDHPDTLVSMNNLASIYQMQKSYEEAEKLYNFILEKRLVTLGEDHPMYLDSLFNLGVYYNSRGMNREAKEMLDKCAELRSAVLGPTHELTIETLTYLDNVGNRQFSMKILTEEVIEDV